MSDKKKRISKKQNNNNSDETSLSSKPETKGLACLGCKARKKKCDRGQPSCQKCIKLGQQCLYRMKYDSTLISKYSPAELDRLQDEINRAEQLGIAFDAEIRRQVEEIDRIKKAKNQLVVRSVTLYKCSQLIYMLNCYMPALQPTTGNQVPYIKISHFFRDTNPARQGAMFAMLANAALMLEDTRMADRFRLEANKCLLDAGEPTPQNLALYVSALIDLGTHHQAFFDFETSIKFYYRIKGFAEKYPHLFFAALRRKRANQHSLAYQQDDRFKEVADRQEKEHYSGRFHEMRKGSLSLENSNDSSPNMSYNNNVIEEDDSSDTDLPPEDDGKTTYAVASYALPKTAEESLLFHLGYAFEALMLMTRDRELDMIRKEIKDSNEDKLGEHNTFNEIRERLQALNEIATYCLKKGVIMQWEWFNAEMEYIDTRLNEVEFGRRIFLYGQQKLVRIHGLMASKKKTEAMDLIDKLIIFAEEQFYYGKTNVLGFGYLFSACVCYKYLDEMALFNHTRDIIASYKVPGLLLAERCLMEIDKYVAGKTASIAPYFAKLAAILEADKPEETKFTLLEFTDRNTGELTVQGKAILPERLHQFKSQRAYTNNNNIINNNDNTNISQAQATAYCESSSGSFSEPDQHPVYQQHAYGLVNNSNNNHMNSKQDVYENGDYMQDNQGHEYAMAPVEDLDAILGQEEDFAPQNSILLNVMNDIGIGGPTALRAPHLQPNHQLFSSNNNNSNVSEGMFYVQEYNDYSTIGNYTLNNDNQHMQTDQEFAMDPHPYQVPQQIQPDQHHGTAYSHYYPNQVHPIEE